MTVVKLMSWNVNGIRAALQKGFLDFVKAYDPDVLCIQETKAHPEQVDCALSEYYHYWNSAERKGYSGVAVFTKVKPLAVTSGIGIADHDREGRVLTLDFGTHYLVNVYTPNAGRDLSRLPYRVGQWDVDFLKYLKKLEQTKPVVFCGDLNVAHKEIDLANPKANRKNSGFTPEERANFDRLVDAGFVDTFRHFCSDPGRYSWWTYRAGARERNVGWRIDYFCASKRLTPCLVAADIHDSVMGSDHCPVELRIDLDRLANAEV